MQENPKTETSNLCIQFGIVEYTSHAENYFTLIKLFEINVHVIM